MNNSENFEKIKRKSSKKNRSHHNENDSPYNRSSNWNDSPDKKKKWKREIKEKQYGF